MKKDLKRATEVFNDFIADVLFRLRGTELNILCDENTAPQHKLTCARAFHNARHINAEGMMSATDQQVWDYAVQNSIDLIVTHDRVRKRVTDLTYIARKAWDEVIRNPQATEDDFARLPMLLHLSAVTIQPGAFSRQLKKSAQEIFRLHAQKPGPVMRLTNNGLAVTMTREQATKWNRDPEKVARGQAIARSYYQAIMTPEELKLRNDPRTSRRKRVVTRMTTLALKTNHEPFNGISVGMSKRGRESLRRFNQMALSYS